MSEVKIYSMRQGAEPAPPGAVRVDRGTPWENPYEMENRTTAERNRVCDAFESYAEDRLRAEPGWLFPLCGKPLLCWCKPKPESSVRCHAETLARLANSEHAKAAHEALAQQAQAGEETAT